MLMLGEWIDGMEVGAVVKEWKTIRGGEEGKIERKSAGCRTKLGFQGNEFIGLRMAKVIHFAKCVSSFLACLDSVIYNKYL